MVTGPVRRALEDKDKGEQVAERYVQANGLKLWTESFGNPADPPILLVMGATAQGTAWPDELVTMLAAGARHVIRFDHRDTGQSTCVDFATDPYAIDDLVEDAIGVLDAYELPSAHLVGASMGGIICQLAAADHPDRVRTLTSIMSTPAGRDTATELLAGIDGSPAADELPGPTPEVVAVFTSAALQPPETPEQVVAFQVGLTRALWGSHPFDEDAARRRVERAMARANDYAAAANHNLAGEATKPRPGVLARISAPTLVIHGAEDGLFPVAHGEATAAAIAGAELLVVKRMGHSLPSEVHGTIAAAILAHTAR